MTHYTFANVAQRQVNDGRGLTFDWPSEGATFTYSYSIDGGITWTPGLSTITENPSDGNLGEYFIPYNPAERPAGAGTVIYYLSDGTDTGKIQINVSTVVSDCSTGDVRFTITVQDDSLMLMIGVEVTVFSDTGAALGYGGRTDQNGQIPFLLAAGTYQFQVENLQGYETHTPQSFEVSPSSTSGLLVVVKAAEGTPSDTDIDMSGIKRVKTKHMEIEAFDPRIMQEVRDREYAQPPSFCCLPVCIGVPRCR
jgi:hypothetical protein